jgi:hypothetical protein
VVGPSLGVEVDGAAVPACHDRFVTEVLPHVIA